MTNAERAIATILQTPNPVRMIGSAIWLYLTLLQTVNHRGLVIRTRKQLADALMVTEGVVEIYVMRLHQRRLVEIKSPSPYLVISLPEWADSEHETSVNKPHSSDQSRQIALEVPVSQLAEAGKKKNGVRVSGEGVSLLAELEREFPGAARADLEQDIATHSPAVVQTALTRVRNTPPDQIRKSRLALFRYLLGKLSRPTP